MNQKNQPTNHDKLSARRQKQDRERYGFDDIPVDESTDDSFGSILHRWMLHSFKLDHPDNKLRPVYRFFADRKHVSWIDDLKWALRADMEDDGSKTPAKKLNPKKIADPTPTITAKQPTTPTKSKSDDQAIEININFNSLPKLSSIKKWVQKALRVAIGHKRMTIIAVIVIVACGSFINSAIGNQSGTSGSSNLKKEDLGSAEPEFGTLLPNGRSIDELGGWKRVSPPGAAPVFAYSDKIGDVTVAVSQQTLPEAFEKDTSEQITELAKGFNATDKITTEGKNIVYIGTSTRGPQYAIMGIDELLILIKANAKIEDESWAEYVDSLISPIQKF